MIREFMSSYPLPHVAASVLVLFVGIFTFGIYRVLRDHKASDHSRIPLE